MFGPTLRDLPPVEPMWSSTLTTAAAERGTLALTAFGPVLGCPRDTTEVERDSLEQRVTAWQSNQNAVTLVLPFPVDVSDLTR